MSPLPWDRARVGAEVKEQLHVVGQQVRAAVPRESELEATATASYARMKSLQKALAAVESLELDLSEMRAALAAAEALHTRCSHQLALVRRELELLRECWRCLDQAHNSLFMLMMAESRLREFERNVR